MKQLTIEMPVVAQCLVEECAYNADNRCHARAITVGDGAHARCDTLLTDGHHVKEKKRVAGVGACKVAACRYNEDYECIAEQITVGGISGAVRCLNYRHR